jgi:aconitase A
MFGNKCGAVKVHADSHTGKDGKPVRPRDAWNDLMRTPSILFPWQRDSTYVRQPPYFRDLQVVPPMKRDIRGARVLAILGNRIHRTQLVGMGVLRLQLAAGITSSDLALDGSETFDVLGLGREFGVRDRAILRIHRANGRTDEIELIVRLDTPEDIAYWRNGGILPLVWREYSGQLTKIGAQQ